eukprot:6187949-Pleurochrysis_carterae.AAC.2
MSPTVPDPSDASHTASGDKVLRREVRRRRHRRKDAVSIVDADLAIERSGRHGRIDEKEARLSVEGVLDGEQVAVGKRGEARERTEGDRRAIRARH